MSYPNISAISETKSVKRNENNNCCSSKTLKTATTSLKAVFFVRLLNNAPLRSQSVNIELHSVHLPSR